MSRRLAVLALLAVTGPAWAHVGAPILRGESAPVTRGDGAAVTELGPEAFRAIAPTVASPWLLAAGAALLLALTLRRRGAVALALLVLLACGVFEAGMHSVHHLTEADAAKCSVAAVSSHAGGVVPNTIDVERPADIVSSAAPSHATAFVSSRPSAPDLGRAPPAA